MLVKTAHSKYPKEVFNTITLERGEWATLVAKVDDTDLMAVKFIDLQPKMFTSTCFASTSRRPRNMKHHGQVSQPQVAVDYLDYAAGIDIHNHVRTGSTGFEDAWLTKIILFKHTEATIGKTLSSQQTHEVAIHQCKHCLKFVHPPPPPPPHTHTPVKFTLYAGASLEGCGGLKTFSDIGGMWSESGPPEHISIPELLAVKFVLQSLVTYGTLLTPYISGTSPLPAAGPFSKSNFEQMLGKYNLPALTVDIIGYSWRGGTKSQYDSAIRGWRTFCIRGKIDPNCPSIEDILAYLTHMYDTGLQYNSIASTKSALSNVIAPFLTTYCYSDSLRVFTISAPPPPPKP